jgi:rhomboid family GlyGly-CTERM serine protease
MHATRPQPAPRAWASLVIALSLSALAFWFAPREALDWQPGLAVTQPWRCWTAALVHLSPLHLQANLFGCAVVAAFGMAARLPRRATWAWLAAWPLTHAALAAQPQLLHYSGLSGLLHAGVAIAALHLACHAASRRDRLIGLAVIAGLATKLVLEQAWLARPQDVPGWDVRIAPFAHLTGTVAGLLCAATAQWIAGRRPLPAS